VGERGSRRSGRTDDGPEIKINCKIVGENSGMDDDSANNPFYIFLNFCMAFFYLLLSVPDRGVWGQLVRVSLANKRTS
jgi:hypothetical protein